jgi:hypothetical protein
MAITMTDALVRAILDGGYDAVFNSGTLEARSGAAPGAGAAPAGTLLWSFGVPADAMAAASGRSKQKNGVWTSVGLAGAGGGTVAGHYRFKAVGDTGAATQNEARQEGSITITGGGGDMTVDNPNIATGQSMTVNTFSVAIP